MNWIAYATGAAISLAAADVLVKLAAGKLPNSLGMLLYGSVPFTFGLTWYLLDRERTQSPALQSLAIVYGLGVGFAFAFVTFAMYAAFRAGAPISVVSPLIRLGGLVLASIVGLIIWKEPITARYVVGLALACSGIYLILTR